MFRVVAAIAGLATYVASTTDMTVSPVPNCTYDINKTIVRHLDADSQLHDVIAYLRRASISFGLFSNRHQKIQASQIETFDYEHAQPVKLIVAAESERDANFVKETELLILAFGEGK